MGRCSEKHSCLSPDHNPAKCYLFFYLLSFIFVPFFINSDCLLSTLLFFLSSWYSFFRYFFFFNLFFISYFIFFSFSVIFIFSFSSPFFNTFLLSCLCFFSFSFSIYYFLLCPPVFNEERCFKNSTCSLSWKFCYNIRSENVT